MCANLKHQVIVFVVVILATIHGPFADSYKDCIINIQNFLNYSVLKLCLLYSYTVSKYSIFITRFGVVHDWKTLPVQ